MKTRTVTRKQTDDGLPPRTGVAARHLLAEVVVRAYGLHEVRCQLIASSLRDVYLVDAREGRRVLGVRGE